MTECWIKFTQIKRYISKITNETVFNNYNKKRKKYVNVWYNKFLKNLAGDSLPQQPRE